MNTVYFAIWYHLVITCNTCIVKYCATSRELSPTALRTPRCLRVRIPLNIVTLGTKWFRLLKTATSVTMTTTMTTTTAATIALADQRIQVQNLPLGANSVCADRVIDLDSRRRLHHHLTSCHVGVSSNSTSSNSTTTATVATIANTTAADTRGRLSARALTHRAHSNWASAPIILRRID